MREFLFAKSIFIPALIFTSILTNAQSQTGSFSSVVTIGGSVKQNSTGSNNTQVMSVGGMNQSQTGTFNSTVSAGSISQTANGSNVQQSMNVGSMSNSSAASFTSRVNAKKIEQVGRSGERQELDIGSVTNSNVTGAVNTTVNVNQGIKQVGDGEIAIGAVKNSNIGGFNNSISVNKVEGNNIRIGSVVGGRRYDNDGNASRDIDVPRGNGGSGMPLPVFSTKGELGALSGAGALTPLQAPSYSRLNNSLLDVVIKIGEENSEARKSIERKDKSNIYISLKLASLAYINLSQELPEDVCTGDRIVPAKTCTGETRWKLLNYEQSDATGFVGTTYLDLVTGKTHVAFGGTTANTGGKLSNRVDFIQDMVTDASLIYSIPIPFVKGQLDQALTYFEQINATYNISSLVGHSLGGALATHVGLKINSDEFIVNVVTVNSAPVDNYSAISESWRSRGNFSEFNSRFYNIVANNDLLTTLFKPTFGATNEIESNTGHSVDALLDYYLWSSAKNSN